MSVRLDAMILAAGQGSRLKPLTDYLAKPLMPFFGKTLLRRAVERASELGAETIVVNAHYHPQAIAAAVAGMQDIRPRPQLSPEAEVLGPIGGIRHALNLFSADYILVMNADAYMDTTPPALRQACLSPSAEVSLLCSPRPSDAPQVIGLGTEGRISSIRGIGPGGGTEDNKVGFLGISLWSREVLQRVIAPLKNTPLDLVPTTAEALFAAGVSLKALSFLGYFCDAGTPERVLSLHRDMLDGKLGEKPELPQRQPGQHIGPFVAIHPKAKLHGPLFIPPHCRIEEGARLVGPVSLAEGVTISKNAVVENSIIFSGNISAGEKVRDNLIFRQEP